MIISSKGRYALRVMVYLAVHHSDEYIPLKEISEFAYWSICSYKIAYVFCGILCGGIYYCAEAR